jgi:flavin-binding protein dodecin
MSIHKVIEILSNSDESWEAAAKSAVKHAAKTVRNIQSVYVQDLMAKVVDNEIVQYRLNAKITFLVEED